MPPPLELSFEQALALALEHNPDLVATRLGAPVAEAEIGVARERPNPELELESSRETPHDALTVVVPIETGGKRRRRVALAEAGLDSARAELAAAEMSVRVEVRSTYYELVAANGRLGEARRRHELAERTRQVTAARFEAGAVPRLDVLQAELALDEASSDVADADAERRAAAARLAVLLGEPVARELTVTGDLADGVVADQRALATQALASNAELRLAERRLAEGQARLALERAAAVPDLRLSGGVAHDSPPEFDYGWRAALGIEVPILNRHRAARTVAERDLARLEAERGALSAHVSGEVTAAAALADSRRSRYLQYRDRILPAADELERMAEDAYQAGKTGLPALLQSLQATRETRLRALDAGLAYQQALAELERAVGAAP